MVNYRSLLLISSVTALLQGCMHETTELEPSRWSTRSNRHENGFTVSESSSAAAREEAAQPAIVVEKPLAPLADLSKSPTASFASNIRATEESPEVNTAHQRPIGRERVQLQTARDRAAQKLISSSQQYAKRKQWNLAQTNIERAYQIAPQNPAVTRTKAEILAAQRRYEEAESWALRTVALLRRSSNSRTELLATWQIILKCRIALGQSGKSRQEAQAMIHRLKGENKKL
jgi:tetratricopeptide (TPR) repeat protein